MDLSQAKSIIQQTIKEQNGPSRSCQAIMKLIDYIDRDNHDAQDAFDYAVETICNPDVISQEPTTQQPHGMDVYVCSEEEIEAGLPYCFEYDCTEEEIEDGDCEGYPYGFDTGIEHDCPGCPQQQ